MGPGRLRALGLLCSAVLLLSACTVLPGPVSTPSQQAESAAGMNSSFSKAGVAEIAQSRSARIDLRTGTLTAQDLGVGDGDFLWDVSVPLDRPVALTVLGPGGTLEAQTSTIRILARPDGVIRTISFFLAFTDVDALAEKARADAELLGLGLDLGELESFLRAAEKEGEHQMSLNGGDALGFQASINLTIDRGATGQVLQYVINPGAGD